METWQGPYPAHVWVLLPLLLRLLWALWLLLLLQYVGAIAACVVVVVTKRWLPVRGSAEAVEGLPLIICLPLSTAAPVYSRDTGICPSEGMTTRSLAGDPRVDLKLLTSFDGCR